MSLLADRRTFVRAAVGVVATASAARAQTGAKTWRVGWARAGSPGDPVDAALRNGLRTLGYVDRIFKGANSGELPVERPTTFELVIHVKTAKALGLTMPHALLARAGRVIQ